MCPAVPSVRGASAKRVDYGLRGDPCLRVSEGPRVEEEPAVARAADDRRICGPQAARKLIGPERARVNGANRTFELEQRQCPSADLGGSTNHARPAWIRGAMIRGTNARAA